MATPPRITCPHCNTSYTCDRCGITAGADVKARIFCGLCQKPFQVTMTSAPLWKREKLTVTSTPCA